ncbi:G-protein coupled receptor [Colletotrichum caudatum]|nr:G-protein coupled receptor [Colletotrichum caudatum]
MQNRTNLLVTIERVGGALSLLGVALVFLTYGAFKRMRSLQNLFILLASIANAGASIACVIGHDGIRLGEHLALCQIQAFLLETFLQSDPLWSFAMAINAFLVVFHGVSPSSIQKYIWVYCIICFAGPLIPGLCLLLIKPEGSEYSVYGDAALWCWITSRWSSFRIYACYIPVWCCILGSAAVYLAVGCHLFRQRNQLTNVVFSSPCQDVRSGTRPNENSFAGKVSYLSRTLLFEDEPLVDTDQSLTGHSDCCRSAVSDIQPPRSVLINDTLNAEPQALGPWHTSGDQAALRGGSLGFVAACYSGPAPFEPRRSILGRDRFFKKRILSRVEGFDPIKLAFLRVCSLFAVSVLFTWTPGTINVVYEFVKPDDASFGLHVACATVLPLQGVWNAVIFLATNWSTFRKEWAGIKCCRLVRCLDRLGDDYCRQTRSEILECNPEQLIGRDYDLPNNGLEIMTPSLVRNVRMLRGTSSV